ncbi:hypothetical protein ASH00_15880 [Arthrobacter sp. Soil782]|uniref:hypothetical protein n=1 Tax=Arthrobacter sp. Soil782 TaxID=1736410 RepID=UPI0006F25A70|nr:hypothetical protein [Arthrobacter sp. Soil782]KRF03264.1 hypothetical protein ASH00_15880 [Arthrobacter sp. Soil782]
MIKLAHGHEGVLSLASITGIAETLIDLNEGNIAAAEIALLEMDETTRMEAFGLDLDDPKSYAAAQAVRLFAA